MLILIFILPIVFACACGYMLFRLIYPDVHIGFGEPPCLKFLRGLAAQHEPYIRFEKYSRFFDTIFTFPDVTVRLEWDYIKEEWTLDVRDRVYAKAIHGFIFDPPKVVVDFLLERYDLKPKVDEMIAKRHAIKIKGDERVAELRKRYEGEQ
jgi:hypothetical protein